MLPAPRKLVLAPGPMCPDAPHVAGLLPCQEAGPGNLCSWCLPGLGQLRAPVRVWGRRAAGIVIGTSQGAAGSLAPGKHEERLLHKETVINFN